MKLSLTKSYVIYRFAILIAIVLLLGCGSGDNSENIESSNQSATITFQLEFTSPLNRSLKASQYYALGDPDICADYLIDTIKAQVCRLSNNTEASSAEGDCSNHSLTIKDVPAGENLFVICKGIIGSKTDWQGQVDGIVAIAGQNTNVGIIQMQYIGDDTSSPEVVSTFPPNEAVNVDLMASTTVVFNEALAPSSIPDQAITVLKDNNQVPGQVGYDPNTYTIRFTPTSAIGFDAETTYTASFISQDDANNTITDSAANTFTGNFTWEFTTRGLQDTVAPQIVATSPGSGATEVGQQISISAMFSEPMAPDSMTGSVFQISSDQGMISGQIVYDDQTRTVTMTPDLALDEDTLYTAVITTGAKDLSQNGLLQPYTWQFRTARLSSFTLSVTKTGNGTGDIASVPPGIDCGNTCHVDISKGTVVTLVAEADSSSEFTGWSGDYCSGRTGDCTFTMTENTIITANFALRTYTITTSVNPENGSGGFISPITATVPYGDDKDFIIQPNPFYSLSNLIVDGEIVKPATSYLFENVTGNHTLIAIFKSNKLNVSDNEAIDDTNPQLNIDGHVVWRGDDEIFYYNGSSKTNLSNTPSLSQTDPQINAEGHIVWLGYTVANGIYYWDQKNVRRITTTPGESVNYQSPQINDNGEVVFPGNIDSYSSNNVIYFYDFYGDGGPNRISDIIGGGAQINSAGHVVWECHNELSNKNDICYFNGSTVIKMSDIDPNLSDSPRNPQINDNSHIVWSGKRSADSEIYYYNGSTVTSISKNTAVNDFYPQINADDHVVWAGEGEIYYYNGAAATNISNSSAVDDQYPQINASGHVVWSGSDGSDSEIYYYNGSTVTNISNDNEIDDQTPQINANGYVVWAGSDGSDSEIFLNFP